MKYLQNLHQHSTFCDGKNTPEEMVQVAIERGLTAIGQRDEYVGELGVGEVVPARPERDRKAIRQRRRAEIKKTVTRVFVWIALLAMLGSILFQSCGQTFSQNGYRLF